VLRHSVFFLWGEHATKEQKLVALKGLAYLSYACPTIRRLDFGTDLLGGSKPLLESKPWERTPLWRASKTGPVFNYDMALHEDFDDEEGLVAYNAHPAHYEVGVYNESIDREEQTARVDWWYDGPPRVEKGLIRYSSMFVWRDEATEAQKDDVREAFRALNGAVPSLRSLVVGDNINHKSTTGYDFIIDAHFDDLAGFVACREHPAFKEALALAAVATKYEWTARITHRMASG
jgi:hypothetical protein